MASVNEAMRMPRASPILISGPARVGVTYTVAGYFLPQHHDRFRRNYPQVALELFESPRPAIEPALLEGSLDLAVMLVSNLVAADRLQSEILVRSRRRLWTAPEHPLLKTSITRLADVARYAYVTLTVDEASARAERYWARSRRQPNVVFQTSSAAFMGFLSLAFTSGGQSMSE